MGARLCPISKVRGGNIEAIHTRSTQIHTISLGSKDREVNLHLLIRVSFTKNAGYTNCNNETKKNRTQYYP